MLERIKHFQSTVPGLVVAVIAALGIANIDLSGYTQYIVGGISALISFGLMLYKPKA